MAWKIISALSNTQLIFWSNLKAFVQFVFDTKVLTIAAKIKGQAYFKIKEVTFFYNAVKRQLAILIIFKRTVQQS